nr:hypothetical protein OG781_16515 [Streptomyces sp. NBC_00830]
MAHYAIVGLVGDSGLTEPIDAMLGAIGDGIELLRAHGAGAEIKGHRDGYATACPGGPLYAWVQNGAPRPKSQEDDSMAGMTKTDIFNAVWRTDAIAAPSDAADIKTNPNWQTLSVLRDTQARVRSMDKRIAAMSAAITALAGQVGKGADTATIVTAVGAAIESAVIDVNINTKEA